MCGVAGIINIDGKAVAPSILKKMSDVIAHRGPDGEGLWIENNVGLAHRRLAVNDLTLEGHQPMLSPDHRYVLSYNGEIYNFKELRDELKVVGLSFRSNCDTEVVLRALEYWGNDAIERFNGMFALALWDRTALTLLLARDRYGIKPLYWSIQGNNFSFGSEQKAITSQSDFKKNLNKPALLEYFTFQNIFSEKTLLHDINLLPAGHYATLNLRDHRPVLKKKQYWDYHFQEPNLRATDQEYREELDRLLIQAVNRQLVTDVELGGYLSGGMDSGSIIAIAAKSNPYLKTFTCGFDLSSASGLELSFDERAKAEVMSNLFKTEHYEIVLKAGDMERCLPKLAWHLDEPRLGQSYPNYYAAKLASKFVKVVLSGIGGDELFGGYPWRYYRAVNNENFEQYVDKYYLYWQRLINNVEIKQLFAPIWSEVKEVWTRDIFRDVFGRQSSPICTQEDYINHSLYFEAKTFLHGLFIVEDKLSMANSLETRLPFMDNDLVDFAMKCPVNLKLNNLASNLRINENEPGIKALKYFKQTNDGKKILREVMENHLPANVTEADKQGFSGPDASWFKGESIDFVKSKLLNPQAKIYEILDKETVVKLVGEHLNGTKNRRLLLWSLINIEETLEQRIC
jgi:asparagine synthase (glutamine-hydrolysing)